MRIEIAKISSPLSQGWRWLERLDDIDRRFDFFNSEDEDEVISLFRIQIAKFIEAVAILNGVREELDEETIATYRRNIKKKKIDIRVNSLDLLLEHTTYNTLTDNARRWSTYLYAYATPTIAALKALRNELMKNREQINSNGSKLAPKGALGESYASIWHSHHRD